MLDGDLIRSITRLRNRIPRLYSHYTQRFDYACEVEECQKDYIQLLETREDEPEAFQPAEKSLDLVAFLIEFQVVLPSPTSGTPARLGAPWRRPR